MFPFYSRPISLNFCNWKGVVEAARVSKGVKGLYNKLQGNGLLNKPQNLI